MESAFQSVFRGPLMLMINEGFTARVMTAFLAYFLLILICIPLHEYAHAWSSVKLGDKTPFYDGRLTLNPLSHLDPIGTILPLFIPFGWGKPVIVNPVNYRKYRQGYALSSVAGPAMNLIIAYFAVLIAKIFTFLFFRNMSEYEFGQFMSGEGSSALLYASEAFGMLASISVSLAIFNMIPIPPLDGSKVLFLFVSDKVIEFLNRYGMMLFIGLLLISNYTGLLDGYFSVTSEFFFKIFDKLTIYVNWIFGY